MELILHNGKIKAETGDVSAVFCRDGVFEAVGSDEEVLALKTEQTKVIDLQEREFFRALTTATCISSILAILSENWI